MLFLFQSQYYFIKSVFILFMLFGCDVVLLARIYSLEFIWSYFFISSEHIYMFIYFFMLLIISLAFIGPKPFYINKTKFLFKNIKKNFLKIKIPKKDTEYVINTNVHKIFFSLVCGFFFLSNYIYLLMPEILDPFNFTVVFIIYFIILFFLYYFIIFGYLTLYFIRFEYIILKVSCLFSIILFIICKDFCVLYLALELLAICSVILALKNRYSIFALESGLKYFLINGFSSLLLLLGILIIYYCTGSLNFLSIKILYLTCDNIFFVIGFSLLIISILIKLGVFPFHI